MRAALPSIFFFDSSFSRIPSVVYFTIFSYFPMLPPILLLFCVTISQLCSGTFATPINETSPIEIRAPGNFVHPGILIDLEQLEFVRIKVKAKIDPWNTAYNNLRWSRFGDLKRRAHPHTYVDCGFYSHEVNVGCQDEVRDALAAYATSLLWYVTGQAKYAQKSISYMNSWARVIKAHRNKNERIQAGWAAASWTRAAEIIRHTSHHWASKDIQRFENMLRHAYLPSIRRGAPPKYNGNWGLGKYSSKICSKTKPNKALTKTSFDGSRTRHSHILRRP